MIRIQPWQKTRCVTLLLVYVLLGCQLPLSLSPEMIPTSTPSIALEVGSHAEEIEEVRPTPTPVSFAPTGLEIVTPSAILPPEAQTALRYQRDLALMVNPQHLPLLDDEQRTRLLSDGVIYLAGVEGSADELVALLREDNVPIWLSTSAVQAYYHKAYQQILHEVSTESIEPLMLVLAERLALASARQWETAVSNGWVSRQQAAKRNWIYFTIVGRLLDAEFPTPTTIAAEVDDELDLLRLGGVFQSPYQNRVVDYGAMSGSSQSLTRALVWYEMVPVAVAGDTQIGLLHEAMQDEVTADIWARLFHLFGHEIWWDAENGTNIYLFTASTSIELVNSEGLALQDGRLPFETPILVEASGWYHEAAGETRLLIDRWTTANVLREAQLNRLLELEQRLSQLAVFSVRQAGGYRLSAEEQIWLKQNAADMMAESDEGSDIAVVLALYEGRQIVFKGLDRRQ